MDVIPLPERKKHNFQRATQEQLEHLKAGFAISEICSKSQLITLSEATGLTAKWIASWFQRQRKKVSPAGRAKAPKIAEPTPTMSIQEITTFKIERSDLNISDPVAPVADPVSEQKPLISNTPKKKTRTTRKKRNSDTSHPPSTPLKPSFVSEPLAPRPVAPPTIQPEFQAPDQTADTASPTSTFILRQMVPQIYNPHISYGMPSLVTAEPPSIVTASSPDPPTSTLFVQSSFPTSASPDTTIPPQALQVFSWQEPMYAEETPACSDDANASKTQEFRHHSTKAAQPLSATSAVQNDRVSQPTRHPRQLLPLDSPIWNTFQAPQFQYENSRAYPGAHSQRRAHRTTKENQPTYRPLPPIPRVPAKLRSSGSRILPPLFTTTDLTSTDFSTRQLPQSVATYHPPQPTFLPQTLPTALVPPTSQFDLHSHQEPRAHVQSDAYCSPTMTPLKYRDILAPLLGEDLSTDEVLHRLLDERLAVEDPFQAAIGLVFASHQLGLDWDFT